MISATEFQEQWKQTRARMADGVEALLCFDMGLTGVELYGATSYVLDRVVRPEFEKALGIEMPERWAVMTIDENFQKVTVQSDLSQADAMKLLMQLNEAKGYRRHWQERV